MVKSIDNNGHSDLLSSCQDDLINMQQMIYCMIEISFSLLSIQNVAVKNR